MQQFMGISKAMADQNRIRVLLLLRDRELCVCQITEVLGLAPSTVSKHMSILKQAGLVEMRKDGRWAYYRLLSSKSTSTARKALRWIFEALADSSDALADVRRLEEVLAMDPEVLCKLQTGR